MYTDQQQQPVTQPEQSHDATDTGIQPPPAAECQPSVEQTTQNNTAQTVQATLRKLDQWRQVLQVPKVCQRLLTDLNPSDITNFFHYMSVSDQQHIQSREKNDGRTAGAEALLDVLVRLGEASWPQDFCEALRENGQEYLVDLLEEEHMVVVQGHVGEKVSSLERLKAEMKSVKKMQYKPSIPKGELKAMLQYCELWKATVRREKRLLRENVDALELLDYFPYMSNKVEEKVKATANEKGRIRAMDVFIDDGLMYVGDQAWPNDLCFALSYKMNMLHIAEALKMRFQELLEKGQSTSKYRDLDAYLKSGGASALGPEFGEAHSSRIGMT